MLEGIDDETLKSYLAGFFDGEGYIGIERQSNRKGMRNPWYRVIISISLTNENVLQLFQETFGGSISVRTTQIGNHQRSWIWRLWSSKAIVCLRVLYPYLIIKKAQAELACAFQESLERKRKQRYRVPPDEILDWREEAFQKMRELKRRWV